MSVVSVWIKTTDGSHRVWSQGTSQLVTWSSHHIDFLWQVDYAFWSSCGEYVLLCGVVTHGTVWHVADFQTIHNDLSLSRYLVFCWCWWSLISTASCLSRFWSHLMLTSVHTGHMLTIVFLCPFSFCFSCNRQLFHFFLSHDIHCMTRWLCDELTMWQVAGSPKWPIMCRWGR